MKVKVIIEKLRDAQVFNDTGKEVFWKKGDIIEVSPERTANLLNKKYVEVVKEEIKEPKPKTSKKKGK